MPIHDMKESSGFMAWHVYYGLWHNEFHAQKNKRQSTNKTGTFADLYRRFI